MYPKKDNTLSLLGGAALGAVAMYLLDPEAGARRRRDIADTTRDAAHRAGETIAPAIGHVSDAAHRARERIGPAWDRVSDTARGVGASLAGSAGALGHGIADRYQDALDSSSGSADRLGEHVSQWGETIADKFRQVRRSAGRAAAGPARWLRPEASTSHAGAYAATGMGTLLLGAGLMYLLDPTRGRARRARIIDGCTSMTNRTGKTFRQYGKRLRNRASGCAHDARGWLEGEDAVSAERLLQRVRSEIGHVVSHAGAIQVMTDNSGRVTLHGKVLASEADALLSTVNGVGGVSEIVNLLSVKDTEQQMHDQETSAGQPVSRL